jgi:glycosyltransferase involved in cell wall biosynthesis
MTDVSFIVPAFNEEALLAQTLRAIQNAAAAMDESWELIVVDDDSDDDTAAIARAAGARVVAAHCRHIAATRNVGAREAQGRWLIFVDADTLVSPEVVRAAIASLKHGAVGGGCRVNFEGRLPLYGRLLIATVAPLYRALRLAAGCFLFCTAAALQAAGGFDETLYAGEEAFLSRTLSRQGRFVVLREAVSTSGRKLRAHSGFELVGTLLRLAVGGRRAMSRRAGLDIWYGNRRKDPG